MFPILPPMLKLTLISQCKGHRRRTRRPEHSRLPPKPDRPLGLGAKAERGQLHVVEGGPGLHRVHEQGGSRDRRGIREERDRKDRDDAEVEDLRRIGGRKFCCGRRQDVCLEAFQGGCEGCHVGDGGGYQEGVPAYY